jgi:3-isopropylmalate/(R)-2-methylmalate dehydratase large subunit
MDKKSFTTAGRALFLSDDPAKVLRQLRGEDLVLETAQPLRQSVSEDEIVPAWVCYFFHQRLGDFPYLGLQCGGVYPVSEGWVRKGGFSVVVSGSQHGFHGAREAAPYAEWSAGVQVVLAASFDPVYRRNCHAVGLLTSTDLGLAARLGNREEIPWEAFTAGLDPLTAEVVRSGGNFAYTRARRAGTARLPLPERGPRPMTLVEKILARAAVNDLASGALGLPAVAPGDGLLVRADWRISHESATSLASAMLHDCLGDAVPLADSGHILAFHDHLTSLGQNSAQEERQPGLQEGAKRMKKTQVAFCQARGIRLHGETREGGAEGISHVIMAERYVLPGQVIAGTDSHTCHAGALGALGFGIGTADIANAWVTGDICVTVPPTTLVRLDGLPRPGVSAKDLVLHLMASPACAGRDLAGQVLEFQGSALAALSTDERSTLTNMAVDFGALAGIVPPDAETLRFIRERRACGLELEPWMHSDPEAEFAAVVVVDCSAIGPMVAAPGRPGNGVAIADLEGEVAVDIAYVGSCTGGKRDDIERVHEVVKWALDHDLMLPLQVQLFIQLGSEDVRRHAQQMGWLSAFEEAGARVLQPGCGACINAGPGVSTRAGQVTISAFNRNFPGRSGPGAVWLASPATVAASAFCGHICDFESMKQRARARIPGI